MDKEKRKLYYQQNRAQILANAKKWRLNNPEKVKAQKERAQKKLIEKIKNSVIEEKKNRPSMPEEEMKKFNIFIKSQFSDSTTYNDFINVIHKAYKLYPEKFPEIFNKVKQYKKMYNIKSCDILKGVKNMFGGNFKNKK